MEIRSGFPRFVYASIDRHGKGSGNIFLKIWAAKNSTTAGNTWIDYKTNAQIAKELKITAI